MPNTTSLPHEARTNGQLVYVVDDEEIIATTLAQIIRNKGFDAKAFTHPREALETARVHAPDVLLTDAIMHEMNGVELAIEVSRMHPACKVLLLSGQAKTSDLLERARNQGYNFELLAKPVHPQTVLDSLKRLFL
jgi:DNA-binding NtrC family response regulator